MSLPGFIRYIFGRLSKAPAAPSATPVEDRLRTLQSQIPNDAVVKWSALLNILPAAHNSCTLSQTTEIIDCGRKVRGALLERAATGTIPVYSPQKDADIATSTNLYYRPCDIIETSLETVKPGTPSRILFLHALSTMLTQTSTQQTISASPLGLNYDGMSNIFFAKAGDLHALNASSAAAGLLKGYLLNPDNYKPRDP